MTRRASTIFVSCLAGFAVATDQVPAADGISPADAQPSADHRAPASSPKHHIATLIRRYDLDQDGTLSADEIALIEDPKVRAVIQAIDTNRDGVVDIDEARKARKTSEK